MGCFGFFKKNQVEVINKEQKSFEKALGFIRSGAVEQLRQMLAKKEITTKSIDASGKTLLMHAAAVTANANIDLIIELLLTNKAKVDAKDFFGHTALCYTEMPRVLQLLIKAKADVNCGLPIVFLAAKNNALCVRLLIENKAKFDREFLVNNYDLSVAKAVEVKHDLTPALLAAESYEARDSRLVSALNFIEMLKNPHAVEFHSPKQNQQLASIAESEDEPKETPRRAKDI